MSNRKNLIKYKILFETCGNSQLSRDSSVGWSCEVYMLVQVQLRVYIAMGIKPPVPLTSQWILCLFLVSKSYLQFTSLLLNCPIYVVALLSKCNSI